MGEPPRLSVLPLSMPESSSRRPLLTLMPLAVAPRAPKWKIVSAGARDRDGKMLSSPLEVHFRTRNGVMVPYVALDYSNQGKTSPIKEVILGPQNENAESNIEILLSTLGVKDVSVRRSRVPYR
jgi:hypothetical protein